MTVTWGAIHVAAGAYFVGGPDWSDYEFPHGHRVPGGNGLISVFPEGGLAVMHCGTFSGTLAVGLNLASQEPSLQTDDWEEAVEVSLTTATAPVMLVNEVGTPATHLPELPELNPGAAYRIRIHANGRTQARELTRAGALTQPLETHYIAVWEAPSADEQRHKVSPGGWSATA
jgi:hypothetical protein